MNPIQPANIEPANGYILLLEICLDTNAERLSITFQTIS